MSSVCISNCINDARDPRVPVRPVRATYVSLYKWPESDAEFARSVRRGGGVPAPRVVDSISCRQMYLRSYTFSREDDDGESKKTKTAAMASATQKCFGRAKETAPFRWGKEEGDVIMDRTKRRRRKGRSKRKKRFACSALLRFFHRLLSCAATVDVVDPKINY